MANPKQKASKPPTGTFSDHYAAVEFYPDLPKKSLEDILDVGHSILDVHIVEGFKSKFGESNFALILMETLDTGEQFTTLCGGEVVVKKVADAKKKRLLPLIGVITKPAHYYDIV